MTGYLGLLAWYNIGPTDEPLPVARDGLAAWFEELGLDSGFLPPPVRAVEAFRTATSQLTDEWVSDGIRYRLVVREAERTEDYVKRQLWATWSTVEGPQERRVADLQFFRPRRVTAGRIRGTEKLKTMMHQGLQDLDRERLRAVVDRCRRQYEAYVHQLSPRTLREIVRNYLLHLGAISLRAGGGGVFFVPLDQRDQVGALRQLLSRCGPQCRLMFSPMVDDPEQREMLRDSVELDIETRVQAVLRDIADWTNKNPGKRPSTLMWRSWHGEYEVLSDVLVRFGDLLDATFADAADRLEDLGEAIKDTGGLVAAGARGQ